MATEVRDIGQQTVGGFSRRPVATRTRTLVTIEEARLLQEISRRFYKCAMPPVGTGPKGKNQRIRPSSAFGNIQSHPNFISTTLYDDTNEIRTGGRSAESVVRPLQRPKTGGPRLWRHARSATQTALVEPGIQQRRLTLTGVEGIAETEAINIRRITQMGFYRQLKGKIEERISIDTLDELKQAFAAADVGGNGRLNFEQFKAVLRAELHLPSSKEALIMDLFRKIDCLSHGAITWDEFCTYMQLEYAEMEDSYLRMKEVAFILPANITNMPHREPVLRILDTTDGSFMAASQDGLISFWSGNMTLKRTKSIVPVESTQRTKPKWITDFLLVSHFNKIIVATGDRELQFYELSSFEPYCQINSLETVPLNLDFSCTGDDECLLLFGDSQGCVNILFLYSAGESLRTWKKSPKAEGIASISLDQIANSSKTKFIRWKVHGDWVQKLKYYHDIRQIISCSNHENSALVIGSPVGSTHVEQQLKEIKEIQERSKSKQQQQQQLTWVIPKSRSDADQSVFRIYKGVKCFDFSKTKNVIITGGMDRIVRIWNPYVTSKPTGMLRGHCAPICYLFIAEEENRIFSVSTDRCVRIWDIQDQNCLLMLRPKSHRIRGEIQACHYSNISKTLAVASEQMNGLQLKLKSVEQADVPLTHKEPVHAIVYDPNLKQVLTSSDGSVVKLWDFVTGAEGFEFGKAHDDQAITCMTLDDTGRRLITGGRDGMIRVWNYNNGHCLKIMRKERNNAEICAMTYMVLNNNRFVIAVGWDKRVSMYPDSMEDLYRVQHPLPVWKDDVDSGHEDDILSVAQCPPNLLATSSYDGEVIIWSTVSGHIHCHLRAPPPDSADSQGTLDFDTAINKVVFLQTRIENSKAAAVVASGPYGLVHFWNTSKGGYTLARFCTSEIPQTMLTAMETNQANSCLVTGDNRGFVCVWDIEEYAQSQVEQDPPKLLTRWRGHLENVTCIALVEDVKMMITSSLDCTVRLWTLCGHYVGVFGQPDPWDIYNSATFQHPMVPYDVLIDPLSLPLHPLMQEKPLGTEEVLFGNASTNGLTFNGKELEDAATVSSSVKQCDLSDDIIMEMFSDSKFISGCGKRLRHERLKPAKVDRGGPNEYQMLRCYNLDMTSQPESPRHMRKNKEDLLNFYVGEEVDSSR